jgi:hypothetical protein
VFGSKQHYHFLHKASPHVRRRRDTSIPRGLLSNEKSIKSAAQQHGFKRVKRGYRSLEDLKKQFPTYEPPKDPYFKHQWYLVSKKALKRRISHIFLI